MSDEARGKHATARRSAWRRHRRDAAATHHFHADLAQGGGRHPRSLVAGLAGALVAGRLLRGLLYGVAPADPLTLAGAAAILGLVAAAAIGLPAFRLTRVDAAQIIRAE